MTDDSHRYKESLNVLYGSNTFVLTRKEVMAFRLAKLWPASHRALVTSMDILLPVNPKRIDPVPGDIYSAFFNLLQGDVYPNLRRLRIILKMLPRERRALSEEQGDAWVRPWEALAASRAHWERLELIVPDSWKPELGKALKSRTRLDGSGFQLCGGVEFPIYLADSGMAW